MKYFVAGLKKHNILENELVDKMMDGCDKVIKLNYPVIIQFGGRSSYLTCFESNGEFNEEGIELSDMEKNYLEDTRLLCQCMITKFDTFEVAGMYNSDMYGVESLDDEDEDKEFQLTYAQVAINNSTAYKKELVLSVGLALGRVACHSEVDFEALTFEDDEDDLLKRAAIHNIETAIVSYLAVKILEAAGYGHKIDNIYNYNSCETDVIPSLLTGRIVENKERFMKYWVHKLADYVGTKVAHGKPVDFKYFEEHNRVMSKSMEKKMTKLAKIGTSIDFIGESSRELLRDIKTASTNKNAVQVLENYQNLITEICTECFDKGTLKITVEQTEKMMEIIKTMSEFIGNPNKPVDLAPIPEDVKNKLEAVMKLHAMHT